MTEERKKTTKTISVYASEEDREKLSVLKAELMTEWERMRGKRISDSEAFLRILHEAWKARQHALSKSASCVGK